MIALILLNLLNEMRKKIRCKALPSILFSFCNDFNKFNNIGVQMQDLFIVWLKLAFYWRFCSTK